MTFLLSFICLIILLLLCWIFLSYRKREQADYILALEGILKVGGAGVVIFDQQGGLKHANTLATEYLQTLSAAQDFSNLQDFISYIFDHASDAQLDATNCFNAIDISGEAADFHEVVIADDGHSYLVEIYKAQKGTTIVLIRNVSVLRQQNDNLSTLNQRNEELSLAIEAVSCGVFILDAATDEVGVRFMNRMCRADVGFEEVPEDGLTFDLFLSALGDSEDFEVILDCVRNQKQMQKRVMFEGEEEARWFDLRLTPVFSGDDEVDLYIGVMSDITSLKKRETDFNRAQKLESLGQLSAGIAHDFNNILSIVDGYARMIEMNLDKPDKILDFVGKMKETSGRGAGLTKKMMAFARHKNVQSSVSNIHVLIGEQDALLRQLLDASIRFKVSCDEPNLHAKCAGDDFVQIIMNLVVNARDAVSDRGTIDVSAVVVGVDDLPDFIKERDFEYVCLRVMDDGMGMSESDVERMFDPFFTTKEQGKGTGLGLSVVYGLVNDMGGYIDVRSELHRGTEFSVYIPRAQVSEDSVSRERERNSNGGDEGVNFAGYTALVVEDEPDLRGIIVSLLQRHGMDVIEAGNGNDALVVQDDHGGDIDIVITDVVMPGMGGFKLAEMMVALHPDIHVVYISGYPARGEGAVMGMPDDAVFVPKPIDFNALYACVQAALSGGNPEIITAKSKEVGGLR